MKPKLVLGEGNKSRLIYPTESFSGSGFRETGYVTW